MQHDHLVLRHNVAKAVHAHIVGADGAPHLKPVTRLVHHLVRRNDVHRASVSDRRAGHADGNGKPNGRRELVRLQHRRGPLDEMNNRCCRPSVSLVALVDILGSTQNDAQRRIPRRVDEVNFTSPVEREACRSRCKLVARDFAVADRSLILGKLDHNIVDQRFRKQPRLARLRMCPQSEQLALHVLVLGAQSGRPEIRRFVVLGHGSRRHVEQITHRGRAEAKMHLHHRVHDSLGRNALAALENRAHQLERKLALRLEAPPNVTLISRVLGWDHDARAHFARKVVQRDKNQSRRRVVDDAARIGDGDQKPFCRLIVKRRQAVHIASLHPELARFGNAGAHVREESELVEPDLFCCNFLGHRPQLATELPNAPLPMGIMLAECIVHKDERVVAEG